jgi:hypothetical protein
MKKTSLFPNGNSRANNSGRRREESGRKSREGTTEVGETGLYYYRNVKGGARGGGGNGRANAFDSAKSNLWPMVCLARWLGRVAV